MYRSMAQITKLFSAAKRTTLSAAFLLVTAACLSAEDGDGDRLDALFNQLKTADLTTAKHIEHEINLEWSDSGSPAMNLLLQRGRNAISGSDYRTAIRHLSALVEHAPDFAEGWNARATAYFLAGHHELSLNDIGRTLMLEPRHFGALSGFGMIMERRGDYLRALRAFELVLEIYPSRQGLAETITRLRKKTSDLTI